MKQPEILVTGATGKTGRAVVDDFLAKGVPVRPWSIRKMPAARRWNARGRNGGR
jgi:uncharacterized protein YbjT (DUF2867 family)